MKICKRDQVFEARIESHDAPHRLALARAFLLEAEPRTFCGMPEDWHNFTAALQGIEGGTLLVATGSCLEPVGYPIADCEVRRCACGNQIVTGKPICEFCETGTGPAIPRGEYVALVEESR